MSALLISAMVMEKTFTINVTGTHGMAYVEMTRLMMKQFGLDVMQDKKNNSFIIPKKAAYESLDYDIEPDVSAACYFYAMSPLLHVKSQVMGVHQNSLQGDVALIVKVFSITIAEKEGHSKTGCSCLRLYQQHQHTPLYFRW